MAIPEHDPVTGALPPGDHEATLREVEQRYGTSPRRVRLLQALRWVVNRLDELGCMMILLDGSFTSEKHRPSDIDVIVYLPPGVLLPPLLRDHAWLKSQHGIDLWTWPSYGQHRGGGPATDIKNFFSTDRLDRPTGFIDLVREDDDDQES